MLAENLYHGTHRERGQNIICNSKMDITVGDNHWLGNGSYFYVESLYAYKWIIDMYKYKYHKSATKEALSKDYMILLAKFNDECRIFDLTKAEYKIIFDKAYEQLSQKKEYSERFKNGEIAEGVVINYLFNILNYIDDFDIVRAIFILNEKRYKAVFTRIGFMPQEQICVKNLEMVKDISEYNYNEKIPGYEYLINNLYFHSTGDNNGYTTSRKTKYRSSSPKTYKRPHK